MVERGTYSTTRRKHGHNVTFYGGEGYHYIEVRYDGCGAVDVINCYGYEAGASLQTSRAIFLQEVADYMRDLDKHDANEYANASREF